MVGKKDVFDIVNQSSEKVYLDTLKRLDTAVKAYGEEKELSFPQTEFELPVVFCLYKEKINKLGQLVTELKKRGFKKGAEEDADTLIFNSLTAAICIEIEKALELLEGKKDDNTSGFIHDVTLRELGVHLVDETITGIGILIGKAKDPSAVNEQLVEMQENGILTLVCGELAGQLKDTAKIGMQYRTIILGEDEASIIFAVNLALRAALTFGDKKRGQAQDIVSYVNARIKAFIIAVGLPKETTLSLAGAALALGIPIISDQNLPQIDGLLYPVKTDELVKKAFELKKIKTRAKKIDLPIRYGFIYTGERIRKGEYQMEGGGTKSPGFLLVKKAGLDEIKDHDITVIGKDIDGIEEGGVLPLGFYIQLAGEKMLEDFESIIEGKMEDFINQGEGVWQVGKRTFTWTRISKEAFKKGFRLRHLGEIIYSNLHEEYGQIVDKVSIKIVTDESKVNELLTEARSKYEKRDKRMKGMTDESVDTFYTCLLCQSFAQDHVCIVSPERVGLCGAVSWLDAKTGNQISPSGGNQPIRLGNQTDDDKRVGHWNEIDRAIERDSHGVLKRVNMYSIMEDPMTSCGCFECIAAILPEANGIILVNREFEGMTPTGMKFTTLAGTISGGHQVPGFMGVSRAYVSSKKFILTEGGMKRVVWMTSALKKYLSGKIESKESEIDPALIDMIADENSASTPEQVIEYITKKDHPVLKMSSLI